MSKKTIIIGIIVIVFLLWLIQKATVFLENKPVDKFKLSLTSNSIESPVYILSDKSLTFAFAKGTPYIKLVVNANLKNNNYFIDHVNFGIQYEILDSSGKVLEKNDYYFRSKVSVFSTGYNGQTRLYSSSYYLNENLVPTDGSVVVLSLEKLNSATEIRIKSISQDPIVQDLSVRVYLPNKVSEYKLAYLWDRLSEREKFLLSKASIYPYALLTKKEKANLISQNWIPIGPQGIEGIQYSTRQIYTLKENPGAIVNYPILPWGIIITPYTYGTLPLIEPGKIKLTFDEFQGTSLTEGVPIKITFFGRGISEMYEKEYIINEKNKTIEDTFDRGTLQIEANAYLSALAFEYDPNQKSFADITPQPTYLQTYQLGQKPILYEIAHEGAESSPFMFEFRVSFPANGKLPEKPQQVYYRVFDKNNRVIQEGNFNLTFISSFYDSFTDVKVTDRVSDPVKQYFLFPEEAVKVEITSPQNNLLVNAGNRPNHLIRKMRIPEDSLVFDVSKEWQASWFYLQPINYKELVSSYLRKLLRIQAMPPQYDPNIFLGNYQWTEIRPFENYLARWVLLPTQGMYSNRDEDLSTYYLRFKGNETINADFRKMMGMRYAEPSILWWQHQNNYGDLKVFIDGKLNYNTFMAYKTGVFNLLPVFAKLSRLKIESPPETDFFINFVNPRTANYIKRTINLLDNELTFNYERTNTYDSTLIGYYFTPYQKQNERSLLHVKISPKGKTGIGPWDDWTFYEYYLDIKTDKGKIINFLNEGSELPDRGQVFFMPAGPDLNIGNYEIKVKYINGSLGYLGLSSITPGLIKSLKVRFENEVGYD